MPLALLSSLARKPFVRDVATMQVGQFFIMGFQFLLSIILARWLGARFVGLYAITLTIVGTLGLITDVGQNYSLLTLLPEGYGRKSKEDVTSALSYFVQIFIWWVLPVVTIMIALTPIIMNVFYPEHSIDLWVQLGLLTLLLLPIHDFVTLTLQGTRNIKALTLTDVLFGFFDVLFPFALLILWEKSVTSLMIGRLCASAAKASVSLMLWRYFLCKEELLPTGKEVIQQALRRAQTSGIKLGLWISADRQFGNFIVQTPIYILGMLGSATLVGQYKYLMSYVGISGLLVGSIGRLMTSVLPMIYTNNSEKFSRSFWQGNIASMILTFFTLVPLLILGNRGIGFLYGSEFIVPTASFPLLILMGFNGITVGFAAYYRIHRSLHLMIWAQCVSSILGLLLGWIAWKNGISLFVSTVVYTVAYPTFMKIAHLINFRIMRKKERMTT